MIAPQILVVDDFELILDAIELVLNRKGYQPDFAQSGQEAWDKFREHPYALVVTDIVMPGLDGIELIRRIKSDFPETRIIAMTGYGLRYLVEARNAGADFLLSKPFTAEKIFQTIDTCG